MADEGGRVIGSVSVQVVPDATGFVPKLKAELDAGTKDIGEAIGRNIGSSMADAITPYLEQIKLKLDELGSKDVNIRVKVDDNGGLARTQAEVAAVDSAASSGGGGFDLFGSKIANIGGLAVGAADIAIPALLAIGAAAAGLLAGAGVLALGFSGIGDALQAHGQKSSGGGGGASSQLGLQSAQISATQATQSAQDQLTQATQTQTKAELDLHDARVQALQDLQDLDNELKDNTISQAQAAINLREAQATLAVTLAAPGASQSQYADQVAQARLDVAAAQQKVSELSLNGQRLSVQAATASKQGVDDNPKVVAATQDLADANHKLAEAQANIAVTAQKNAIALQQAGAAASGAAGGVDSFGDAMAKLNPIQQQFVEFLLTLKPLLDDVKLAASAFLPGLEQGIKDAEPAFGPILTIVGNVAKALGSVFTSLGKEFASPEGQQFLTFLSVELPKQVLFLGNLFIDLGKIVSGIFEAAGPLIDAFDQAFLGMLDSVGTAANGGGLKAFFASLVPLVQPLFKALSAVGGQIVSALKAVAPALPPVLDLITSLADATSTLISGPVGQELVQTFIDLVTAVSPLVPLFVEILQTILPPFITLIDTLVTSGIGPLVTALSTALMPVLPVLGQALTDLVTALAPFIVQVVTDLVPILPTLATLFIGILNAIIPLIAPGGPLTQLLAQIGPLIKPIVSIVDSLLSMVNDLLPYLPTLLSGFTSGLTLLAPLLGPLASILKTVADQMQRISDLAPKVPDFIKNGGFTETVQGHGSVGKPGGKASGGPVFAGMTYKVNEFGSEMFIPKVDGTIINAVQTGHVMAKAGKNGGTNIFNNYSQSDPVATSHATANRFAARGV